MMNLRMTRTFAAAVGFSLAGLRKETHSQVKLPQHHSTLEGAVFGM